MVSGSYQTTFTDASPALSLLSSKHNPVCDVLTWPRILSPDANTRNFNEHLPSLPPSHRALRVACRCILWPHFYIYFVSLPFLVIL